VEEQTRLVHINKDQYDIYIGRPSKWGNPYSHKPGTLAEFRVNTIKEAIDSYEIYLLNNIELLESIHEIKGKTLGCWCTSNKGWDPNDNIKCHGQILQKYLKLKDLNIEYYLERDRIKNNITSKLF